MVALARSLLGRAPRNCRQLLSWQNITKVLKKVGVAQITRWCDMPCHIQARADEKLLAGLTLKPEIEEERAK
jgi:hypothetical protein